MFHIDKKKYQQSKKFFGVELSFQIKKHDTLVRNTPS